MADYIVTKDGELMHYGVKGMKWGVRRDRVKGGGIAGAIRRKQRANAENDLNKTRSQQRQVDSELRELRGYDKNPSKLGKSKISTAIRRSQIKSLEKTKASLKKLEKENVDALKELDSIERYQAKKVVTKALRKLTETKDIGVKGGPNPIKLGRMQEIGMKGGPKRDTRLDKYKVH